jgi:hypothetical protein
VHLYIAKLLDVLISKEYNCGISRPLLVVFGPSAFQPPENVKSFDTLHGQVLTDHIATQLFFFNYRI